MAKDSENEPYGSLENLQLALSDDICAVEWLNEALAFLTDGGFSDEISSCYIVLDQTGCLDKLPNLCRDDNIDEELKDISDGIDLGLREKLRDKRLTSLSTEDGNGVKGNQEVVREVIASTASM